MELARIEELIELMRRSGVMELSLELPDGTIRIKRAPEGEAASAAPPSVVQTPPATASAETASVPVPSPVVGVFHAHATMGQKALAVGDRVTRGARLAIVEAMKVPNEVRSPVDGMVTALLAEEGQSVEFGQTLFTLRPEEDRVTDESETSVGLA